MPTSEYLGTPGGDVRFCRFCGAIEGNTEPCLPRVIKEHQFEARASGAYLCSRCGAAAGKRTECNVSGLHVWYRLAGL